MINLKTNYMGLELKNPIIVGACSLSRDIDILKKLEASGAAAIVIKSLFEEEIQLSTFQFNEDIKRFDDIHAEMTSIYPDIKHSGPKEHLYFIKKAKEALTIPVIASLNAVNLSTWIKYSKALEEVGADALELNFYSLPKEMNISGDTIEKEQIEILKAVKKTVEIPVSVKLSPYYSSISHFTHQLDEEKVDGLILFNRLFQPEIDIHEEKEKMSFEFSTTKDHQLPLRWTALLSKKLKTSIISSTGIMSADDVIKMIFAGATGVQMVSALYKNNIEYVEEVIIGIEEWMKEKGYVSLDDFRGKLAKGNISDPWAYERSQYIKILLSNQPL
ncbi:dihydroorotate dehydrogenase-like protein [Alkaliphilus peptidifermentans]|uniref:Dihydroorotate dehydrogenase (Fumarate) n=1 Tax=Alkaliphilus peptidifermentans DSM 18978 TaxID=1120976 RepID=A0A1G5BB64_9FIRM|nr:dihydroorotate dehydrogenase-like protein [Alkaliphilus peptidifermentans]SCX87363.1 dihydroorotate dehydrogenase (fumarate) [Alkaliphilus peptidifermentans DSM 18978]